MGKTMLTPHSRTLILAGAGGMLAVMGLISYHDFADWGLRPSGRRGKSACSLGATGWSCDAK